MIDIKVIASSSAGNCYLVSDGSYQIMIECGISWRDIQKATGFKSCFAGCLITHSHQDHCKSIKDVTSAGIDCYMRQETADELSISGYRVKIVEPMKQFRINTWSITPFDIVHDVPGLGFCLDNQNGERLVYITDTAYVVPRFSGMTHIMVECNYALDILNRNIEFGIVPAEMKNRLLKAHFSLEHVKQFLKANDLSRVQEIHLLHLSSNNSNEDRFKREIQSLTGKPVFIAMER